MTAFEAGFIKEASIYGISHEESFRILKLAASYDDSSDLFKSLAAPSHPEEEQQEDPSDLENLAELLRQDIIDRHMSTAKHRIQF